MRTVLVIVAVLVLLLLLIGSVISGEIAREPLDRLWEEHMLTGTSVIHANGKRSEYVPERSFESAKGIPDLAWTTRQGIAVSDHRERRRLGLWLGGGWILHGGLLAKVEERDSTIELYGKLVVRAQPYPILTLLVNRHPDNEERQGYEFFLLHRKQGTARATILGKWIFRPEEIRRIDKELLGDLSGYLRYDPTTKTATVTITGLMRPFEEHIDLSKALRD